MTPSFDGSPIEVIPITTLTKTRGMINSMRGRMRIRSPASFVQ